MTIEITAVAVTAEEQHPNDNPPPPEPPLLLRTTTRTTKTKTKRSSSTMPSTTSTSSSTWLTCSRPSNMSSVIIMVIAFLFLLPVVYVGQTAITGKKVEFNVVSSESGGGGSGKSGGFSFGIVQPDPPGILPPDLMESVYNAESDFRNAQGIAPTYWNCSTDGNCDSNQIWGPCYAPHGHVHWKQEVATASAAMGTTKSTSSSSAASMPPHYFYNHDEQHKSSSVWNAHPSDPNDVANTCRPGFLIIGAGKCGTSSLYHYLVSHPRVLPAQHKQIHYFKYYYMRHTLKWYYSYFPTAVSYLSSGALMTGEASPGYLPYPDVPNRIHETMGAGATPRIIVVGRHPLERAYSSYKYNYVSPNMDAMKQGRVTGIPAVDSRHGKNSKNGNNSNSNMKYNTTYYKQFVFSFEEMLRAELSVLRTCLDPQHGAAIVQAKETWGSQSWAAAAYSRRNATGLGPMADLDGFCYGDEVNATVPRVQWAELMARNPHKIIINKDLHLVQSLLGRSIYTLPLEWWYAVFDQEDIYFVCTEELRDLSGAPLNALGSFLGLPSNYNFSMAVGEGAFNVAGHKGYDKEVSWDEIELEEAHEKESIITGGGDDDEDDESSSSSPIPLSAEFRQEVEDFLRPYNERLYALTGKRCNW